MRLQNNWLFLYDEKVFQEFDSAPSSVADIPVEQKIVVIDTKKACVNK